MKLDWDNMLRARVRNQISGRWEIDCRLRTVPCASELYDFLKMDRTGLYCSVINRK